MRAAYVACACLVLAFAPVASPHGRTSIWGALGAGIGVGAIAYSLVGHRSCAPGRRVLLPAVGAAFGEEIVWRWGVLAGLAPAIGWPGAFGVSTVGFAYRHTRGDGLVSYLALGIAFGAAFLATGRIEAAIAAHAAYNAFVVLVPR